MTDDFATRVRDLINANPRICEFGCNIVERDRTTRKLIPKIRDGFNGITDAQVDRFRHLCTFIEDNFRPVVRGYHGSYSLKHIIEREKWRSENDRYVSNGEAIVAMMLCGYKPYWSDDESDPNCSFKVDVWRKFKEGRAWANRIWRFPRGVHSGQWIQAENEEEHWLHDTLTAERPSAMFMRGYNETKYTLLHDTAICGACMPDMTYEHNSARKHYEKYPCKSKFANGVIMRQEGWLKEQAIRPSPY